MNILGAQLQASPRNRHSKLECLRHHYKMKENCWIVTLVQQLWFTGSLMQIVKQNLILGIGTFMWHRWEKSVPYWFCLAMKLCIISVIMWILRVMPLISRKSHYMMLRSVNVASWLQLALFGTFSMDHMNSDTTFWTALWLWESIYIFCKGRYYSSSHLETSQYLL